jgi:MFS family permease
MKPCRYRAVSGMADFKQSPSASRTRDQPEKCSPLADRRFRLLWIGQSVSALGDQVVPVALALTIIKASGSASDLGLVLAAESAPRLLLLLVGGVWADRLPRHKVMIAADLIGLVTQVAMGVLLLTGGFDLISLILLAAVSGAAAAFFTPAAAALVPATVAPPHLARANALLGISQQGASVLGPALATAIVFSVGGGWAMLLNAATFAVSIVSLSALRIPHTASSRTGFWTELAQGWQELLRHRWYLTNVLSHAGWNLGRAVYQTLGPLVAVQALGGDLAWGVIAQSSMIGALVGAVIAINLQPRRPLVVANLGLATGGVPLLLLAVSAPAIVVAIASAVMYAGLTMMQALWNTAVHHNLPSKSLSRLSAYDWLVSLGLTPLGLALAGPIGERIGIGTTLIGAAVILSGSSLAVLAAPDVRRLTFSGSGHGSPSKTGTPGIDGEADSSDSAAAPSAPVLGWN